MKRLLLGALISSYIALIGVQSAHYHKDFHDAKADSCSICTMTHQSVPQAPNATPAAVQSDDFIAVASYATASPIESAAIAASARAPPAAV